MTACDSEASPSNSAVDREVDVFRGVVHFNSI